MTCKNCGKDKDRHTKVRPGGDLLASILKSSSLEEFIASTERAVLRCPGDGVETFYEPEGDRDTGPTPAQSADPDDHPACPVEQNAQFVSASIGKVRCVNCGHRSVVSADAIHDALHMLRVMRGVIASVDLSDREIRLVHSIHTRCIAIVDAHDAMSMRYMCELAADVLRMIDGFELFEPAANRRSSSGPSDVRH